MDLKTLENMPPWEWPEDAGALFLETLRNEQADEEDRLLAAELGGDYVVINDELAEALLAILLNGGESEALRAKAAISFGAALEQADIDEFDDPDDVPISEQTFHKIKATLRTLYTDPTVPMQVRRRILEVAVRAHEDWQADAVRAAYASDQEDWRLTAVFCMRFVRGFDAQIVESLGSSNPEIEYEAVCAAGNWQVDAAWRHIVALVTSEDTDKDLLLAAIEAAVYIRPKEAADVLGGLMDSDDEDIVEAVHEALAMAEGPWDEDDDDSGL